MAGDSCWQMPGEAETGGKKKTKQNRISERGGDHGIEAIFNRGL